MIIGAGGSPQHLGDVCADIESKWDPISENTETVKYVVGYVKSLLTANHRTSLDVQPTHTVEK